MSEDSMLTAARASLQSLNTPCPTTRRQHPLSNVDASQLAETMRKAMEGGNAVNTEADMHPPAAVAARLQVKPAAEPGELSMAHNTEVPVEDDVTEETFKTMIKPQSISEAPEDAKAHVLSSLQPQHPDVPAQPAAKLEDGTDTKAGSLSSTKQGAPSADIQSNADQQGSTWLESSPADLADEDFGGVTVRVAALRAEMAAQPNASVLQKRVAEALRSREGTALEKITEEEAEERAMVDVMIAAMHEEEYKEYGFPLPDNEPNPNAVEPRISAEDFEGSEAWAAGSPAILSALEDFKKEWMNQPLPKLWMDVEELSTREGRQEALWCLFDSKMILS